MTYAELMGRAKMCAEGTGNSYEKGMIFAEMAKAEAIMNIARILKLSLNLSEDMLAKLEALEK